MMIKAVSIQPGRDPEVVVIDNSVIKDYYDLTDGGWIEAVTHPLGATMFCNEEGVMKKLAPNHLATELFIEAGVNIYGGMVLGGVVVTGLPDEEGDDTEVPPAFLERVGLPTG